MPFAINLATGEELDIDGPVSIALTHLHSLSLGEELTPEEAYDKYREEIVVGKIAMECGAWISFRDDLTRREKN